MLTAKPIDRGVRAILASLGCMLLSTCLMAGERPGVSDAKVLTFGYIEFAPYYYTDHQGAPRGPLIDLARKLALETGYQLRPVSLPAKRAVKMVASGEVDLWFGLSTISLYNDNVLISSKPVDQLELRVYSRDCLEHFDNFRQLSGKKVVILRGYTYGGLIDYINTAQNRVEALEVRDPHQAVRVLVGRKMDYLLSYSLPMAAAMQRMSHVALNSRVLDHFNVHVTVHKDLPDAKQIMASFEQMISAL
ncbi:transporter substrate-binding domain-containing protein [Pseudomaricurvus alkylphenolicus]|uniref:substrate-binding periplasmic protein n=1 Tax=Pseudomaricurvus alkylphenolicus TaxID=1306991 RepID=UPI00141D8DB4|nr:transporter substrate-binding domain-containing protein [Pseudomaricurvus alkylphenolicus]NIB38584.1 transporter substrate-binding domain-containing protein [Pseudomaricurvus alkylphenolicus]